MTISRALRLAAVSALMFALISTNGYLTPLLFVPAMVVIAGRGG